MTLGKRTKVLGTSSSEMLSSDGLLRSGKFPEEARSGSRLSDRRVASFVRCACSPKKGPGTRATSEVSWRSWVFGAKEGMTSRTTDFRLFEIQGSRRMKPLSNPDKPRPNKAPEPTTRSVTPRAFLHRFECRSRTELLIAARVAPERVVAHL